MDRREMGYRPVYHDGEVNHCPGCGRTHWYIGRLSAECAFCATALPLATSPTRGAGVFFSGSRRPQYDLEAA